MLSPIALYLTAVTCKTAFTCGCLFLAYEALIFVNALINGVVRGVVNNIGYLIALLVIIGFVCLLWWLASALIGAFGLIIGLIIFFVIVG